QDRVDVDEVISSIGRKTIETILTLSAEHVAGEQTPGKISGDIRWHGSQNGRVALADRQLKVKRPRLRHKQEGEVKILAYEALQVNSDTAQHMIGALPRGVPRGSMRRCYRRWPTRPASRGAVVSGASRWRAALSSDASCGSAAGIRRICWRFTSTA